MIVPKWFLALALGAAATHAADVTVSAPGTTATIQSAIDTCSLSGGGRVILSPGQHVAGTILLKDNVILRLEKEAVLVGSLDLADYKLVEPFTEGTGQRIGWCLIGAVDAKNIGIEGPGTIDGRGKELLAARTPADKDKRPALIRLVRCAGVTLRETRLQASAMWMVHLARCLNVNAEGLTLRNHGSSNHDGFDIDSCDGVNIKGCDVDSGDDALCLKSTFSTPCRNVVVRDCVLASDCGAIKFGTESLGGFENIRIENCRITKGRLGGVKMFSVDGGDMKNITISGIEMENVSVPIFIRLGARLKTFHEGDQPKTVGSIDGVIIRDVRAKANASPGILISGIPGSPVQNIILENIQLTLPGGGEEKDGKFVLPEKETAYPEINMFGGKIPAYGFFIRHARDVTLKGCRITVTSPDARPLKVLEDVEKFTWSD